MPSCLLNAVTKIQGGSPCAAVPSRPSLKVSDRSSLQAQFVLTDESLSCSSWICSPSRMCTAAAASSAFLHTRSAAALAAIVCSSYI